MSQEQADWGVSSVLDKRSLPLPTSVPQASERAAVRHPLQAWIEGHYARDRGIPREANPHECDKAMASAWSDGWDCRDYLSLSRGRR